MRTTPIGIAMLNDEREHVYTQNNPENMAVVNAWADFIRSRKERQCERGGFRDWVHFSK